MIEMAMIEKARVNHVFETDEELLKDIANELKIHNAISISSKMFEQDRISENEHKNNLDCLYEMYFSEK